MTIRPIPELREDIKRAAGGVVGLRGIADGLLDEIEKLRKHVRIFPDMVFGEGDPKSRKHQLLHTLLSNPDGEISQELIYKYNFDAPFHMVCDVAVNVQMELDRLKAEHTSDVEAFRRDITILEAQVEQLQESLEGAYDLTLEMPQ